MLTFMLEWILNDWNFNVSRDWNCVGGLGDEVPQKQKLFSCLNTDSSCFGESNTSYNPSISDTISV